MPQVAMAEQAANKDGFIAALDQSGGSTPKALKLYGVEEGAWSNDEEMFGLIHQMRARIIKAPAFTGEKVMGAILFERTMDGDIDGVPTAQYLWEKKGVVPFLKVDKGLADVTDGVKLMKPMPELDALCRALSKKGSSAPRCAPSSTRQTQPGSPQMSPSNSKLGNRSSAMALFPFWSLR